MALGSTHPADRLQLFPRIQGELNAAFEDAMDKMAKSGLQDSKERVIIAKVFLNEMPDLKESYRRDLVALIKDAGNPKDIRTRLKHWEPFTAAPSSLFWSWISSTFSLEERILRSFYEASNQIRNTTDQEFLTTLPVMVSKEPLLERLAQDIVTGVHQYLQEFMKKNLPRLCLLACSIKQQAMYNRVEEEEDSQDQKRRASARSDWFNEIKQSQFQMDSGYVQYVTRDIGCH